MGQTDQFTLAHVCGVMITEPVILPFMHTLGMYINKRHMNIVDQIMDNIVCLRLDRKCAHILY